MLLDTNTIPFTLLESDLLKKYGVKMLVCRLDKLHPVVSGNKLFKLHYFLKAALAEDHKMVLTYGGAYSNHLVATAFACRELGLKSIGIVRGEAAEELSHTLAQCAAYGMQLHFITRSDYKNSHEPSFITMLENQSGPFVLIPEGGYHPLGADGAALIMQSQQNISATHICTAVGTAATLAGIIKGSAQNQSVIAIPVLKNLHDLPDRIGYLTGNDVPARVSVFDEYHFGGYAKKTPGLIDFMNEMYSTYKIPTDFVYTAKMMYAVFDQLKKGYFIPGSTVVCLHTGGLQGNKSLPPDTLIY